MKKIFLLASCFIALAFVGCSKSDDNKDENSNIDPIIGVWNFWNKNGEELSDCAKKSTFEFKADGTAEKKEYYINDAGECILEIVPEEELKGWKKLSENNYEIQEVDGDNYSIYIEFSNNNKTMKIYKSKNDKSYFFELRKL